MLAIICKVFLVSPAEAEANSKTMKALVDKFTCKVGLCSDTSGRVTLLGGQPYLLVNRPLDNGLPFLSAEFARYATTLGFTDQFSTPYWPQANDEVERSNQCLG